MTPPYLLSESKGDAVAYAAAVCVLGVTANKTLAAFLIICLYLPINIIGLLALYVE
tara:strand:+ start:102 stop:269 length:168 start_codon:yes stop_codon:yes gene_type:complete